MSIYLIVISNQLNSVKFAIVFGTRPEIIKFSPVIRYLEKSSIDYEMIHTNQHYSDNMDGVFFRELNLPTPKYNLNVGSSTHAEQTGRMMQKIAKVLESENFTHLFVQGDTNSTMAGALVASKLNIKLCHIEAGLRSYDRDMPEEINRIVTDHISDYLFVPTKIQYDILIGEGISSSKIVIVGNTIVEAINDVKIIASKSSILTDLNLEPKQYCILTLHRPKNVDNEHSLRKIMDNFRTLGEILTVDIYFIIHPRTQKNLHKFEINLPENIITLDPIGYFDMIQLISNSKIIFTDSGGLQEEGCILGIPTITIRENTERSETIESGSNVLVGTDFDKLNASVKHYMKINHDWEIPYLTNSVELIIDFILNQ